MLPSAVICCAVLSNPLSGVLWMDAGCIVWDAQHNYVDGNRVYFCVQDGNWLPRNQVCLCDPATRIAASSACVTLPQKSYGNSLKLMQHEAGLHQTFPEMQRGCEQLHASVGHGAVVAHVCNRFAPVSMLYSSPTSLGSNLVTAWALTAMQIRVRKQWVLRVGEDLVGATLRANSKFGCSGRAAFDFIAVRSAGQQRLDCSTVSNCCNVLTCWWLL